MEKATNIPWEPAPPVLFNIWKHHARALHHRIAQTVRGGPPALAELAERLVVIGTQLMDLYTGPLTPAEIGARVVAALQAERRLEWDVYRTWIEGSGGYAVLTFPEDDSRWVLRLGDEAERYVHVHPGRWTPQTRRVRANVLKTAVLALAHAGIHDGSAIDLDRINAVRREYLGLSPIGKELSGEQGLGAIIDVLSNP
jgi:hypothetical protein